MMKLLTIVLGGLLLLRLADNLPNVMSSLRHLLDLVKSNGIAGIFNYRSDR